MIGRKMLAATCGLVVIAAVFLTTAASASPRHATAVQRQTVPSALRHFAALGIDPQTVVVQRGARNYAGPHCPGKGWTCTSSLRVLQMGRDANKVDCTGGTPSVLTGSQGCVVMQSGTSNSARCVEKSKDDVVAQDCNITQTGARNSAVVDQSVESGGGPTQTATQTAEVTQNASGGDNSLSVKQHVHQHVQSGATQTQDVHQELTVNQTTTGSGNNSSDVKQDQNQDANNATTSQAQNTNASSSTPCPAASLFFVGSDPNECAFVSQTTDAGNNTNTFNQSIDQDEHAKGGDQLQGSFEGGIKAQAELTSTTGKSTDKATQDKDQSAKGGTSQEQIDPMGCCGFSAAGNANSKETLDQSSEQTASTGAAAFQSLDALGFVHTPSGGSCSVSQHVSNNADSSSASSSQPSCESGTGLESVCASGGEAAAAVVEEGPGFCESEPFSPPVSE